MPTFSLNFQQPKQHKPWLGYTLIVMGLAGLIYCYVVYMAMANKIDNVENAIEQISHKKPHKVLAIDRVQQLVAKQQLDFQSKINRSLTTPWPALFQALEASKQDTIILTEILPDTSMDTITIKGQANQLNNALAYVKSLEKESVFSNVSLLDHQLTKSDSKVMVNFEMEASWNRD